VDKRFASILELQQEVIRCPLKCPFRNTAAGYFPKPPRGPDTSPVMIVFENPGSPGARNTAQYGNPEMNYTIENITLDDALRMCIQGQESWLFWSNKLDKQKWDDAGFVIGKRVYTTDSHKCPNPKGLDKNELPKLKEQAREMCLDYLREEIRLIQPRVIIAFGDYARRSVERIEGAMWSNPRKNMPDDQRVRTVGGRLYAVLPHPDSLRYEPKEMKAHYRNSIAFVFGKVKEFLSGPEVPQTGTSCCTEWHGVKHKSFRPSGFPVSVAAR
jgi:uracil-DNA glycosylase family 4